MGKYIYSNIGNDIKSCNGEIWANDDEEAIVHGKEGRAIVIYKMILQDRKQVGWELLYTNPQLFKH